MHIGYAKIESVQYNKTGAVEKVNNLGPKCFKTGFRKESVRACRGIVFDTGCTYIHYPGKYWNRLSCEDAVESAVPIVCPTGASLVAFRNQGIPGQRRLRIRIGTDSFF